MKIHKPTPIVLYNGKVKVRFLPDFAFLDLCYEFEDTYFLIETWRNNESSAFETHWCRYSFVWVTLKKRQLHLLTQCRKLYMLEGWDTEPTVTNSKAYVFSYNQKKSFIDCMFLKFSSLKWCKLYIALVDQFSWTNQIISRHRYILGKVIYLKGVTSSHQFSESKHVYLCCMLLSTLYEI